MATDSSFLSEDQFMCSICLEVFTEPVSIPCGHNFCKACISQHWEGKELCKCPLCNEKFSKGLKLCVNTAFRDVVENFKKRLNEISNNDTPAKAGQVECDCCLGTKFKASKTCLVCLTSFCETHLEPHRKVAALQGHKLTNAIHNLEDKICKKHNRILELFCRNDLTRICVHCTEHSAHDTVPLEEAYVDKSAQMVIQKVEVQEVKRRRGKKGQKSKMQTTRKAKDEAIEEQSQCCFFQCLPGNMGCSEGRFCYHVQLPRGTDWFLGVVRESLLRKKSIQINPRTGSWIIKYIHKCGCGIALHKKPVVFGFTKKPERIMVCVDYDNGLVSFSDAETGTPIYSFTGCKFQERIFLFCGQDNSGWIQWLQMKVQTMNPRDVLLCFLFIIFFLILFSQN
ncbi:E3 ubiquitin-protein ligase TRIM47 [Labrus bergylta]|uniref:E3 ubiquitin-protein ligase TRIM47 n=1 Tax=Labrus bergylta TaxID=56723 RepID=UPI0033134081